MGKEELKKLKDFKLYTFEGGVYVKAEDYKKIAIENRNLEEENKKLKEKVSELEDISKDYDVLSRDFITATGEIKFRKDEVERFKDNAMQDMREITELEIENKKLKSDLAFERTMLDNVKAEYKSLQEIIKKLERDNQRLRGRLDMLGEPTD